MKEYEIRIEKIDEGVQFSWDDDAPIHGVYIDRDGHIMVEPNEGIKDFHYKIVGNVEYIKNAFNLNG